MRFLRNLLLFVILVYGLAYGYLWYETSSTLQRIVQGTASFAKIDYASFFVSPLANEITVDDISIVPLMVADEFRIEQIRLYADMPGFFLISGKSMQEGILPEKMEFNLSSLQINMDGKFVNMLEALASQSMEQPGQTPVQIASIAALGCGDIEQFQLVDYRLMGIKRISADLNLHLTYDKIGEIFGVQIDANTRDIYNISVATDFKVPSGKMESVGKTKSIPPMRLSINDTGFHKMRNAYCSTANKTSAEEYVEHHTQLLKSKLGIDLPDEVVTAYQKYMLNGGRINISIKPQDDISPDNLAYYKPLEVAELLGLKLSIDSTRVNLEPLFDANAPTQLAKAPAKTEPAAKPENVGKEDGKLPATTKPATPKQEEKPVLAVKPEKAPDSDAKAYHMEKVENAHMHIDKMVEVTLPGNKVRRGTLEQVRNNRLYLLMKLQAGTLVYPVKMAEVKKFMVLD